MEKNDDDETESVCSSVTTHELIETLKPAWPRIRLEIDMPGWFILMAAFIIGLKNSGQCMP
jgi:hypothetical protein